MSSEDNKKKGFIKLHRSLLDWEWYEDVNTCRLFIHCLFKANIEDKKWQGVEIKRGSFVTSYENLSNETNLTVRQIRTALNKLKMTNELTHITTLHYSIITIKNYNLYQQNDTQNVTQMTSRCHLDDIPMSTTKEIKNIRNTNSSSVQKNENATTPEKVFKKPSLFEVENYIKEKNLSVDGEKFFYYYESIGWKVGRNPMESWQSALNYWQRTEKKEQQETESWSDYVDRVLGGKSEE